MILSLLLLLYLYLLNNRDLEKAIELENDEDAVREIQQKKKKVIYLRFFSNINFIIYL
jgi:hypothetical protein